MSGAHERPVGPIGERLTEGRERARSSGRPAGPARLFALQRAAGNSAVTALLSGRLKSSGDAVADIDKALTEVRGNDPDVSIVEKGLKATKAAGVPVDLEGEANKPPASALAVVTTGFGPGAVAPKKPVPPPKPTKPVSPLGKAAAKAPKPAGSAKHHAGKADAGATTGVAGGAGTAAAPAAPTPLPADKLLQPPVPPPGVTPAEDPAFAQVKANVKGFAKAKKAHQPASAKAKEAQGAALPPTDDVSGQAKAAKVDSMDAQQAGTFDKKAFIAAVKTAIEAKSPKSLKEADDYKESGKAGEVKGEVKGMVTQGKEGSAKDIEAATDATPDQSKAVPKQVTPLQPEDPGKAASIPASGAAPKPAPAEQTNLAAGKHEVNQEMADAQVSDEQLARSNEPEFQGALADKQKAAEHADTAPAEFREQEKATLAENKAQAGAQTAAGVAGMQGAKGAAVAKLVSAKAQTKSKDEAKRAEVTGKVQEIFAATEADVKKILEAIDPKVEKAFDEGEAGARAKFETYVAAKMSAYKADRYGGWLGGLRWAKDKLLGMPDKVNEFYEAGRELYLKEMDGVISRVADIVGGDLTAAKQRIAKGRADIAAYVKTLSPDLQKVGDEAAKDIGDKFDQLESDVNDKQNSVVDTLASKYVEARKGLDERIEALQAENKGLVDKAIGAIKAVINTIKNLTEMLKNTLARAAAAIGDIIKDPVGFLGKMVDAVKGGINKFFSNIGAHLKKGLMGWLFGQLGDAGIEIPDTFDIKGIIKLLASIFGLTWANIRNRIVKQIGEKAMSAIETGVDIFQKIASGGLGAVWELLMEKLGDIKNMIMEQIEDFVLTKIITAGITWLISLLNPAAAFIKACKLIYDVVMFFVNNADRILKFVNTVIDGIVDIAKGNISSVVDKIEDALSQMVPILIGFIASVLGIGGIGEKIKSIIQALQKPVNKALDFVIKTGLKLAGPVIRAVAGIGAKIKGKVAAGKAWVKGKADAAKGWVKGKVAGVKDKVLPGKFEWWKIAMPFTDKAGRGHRVFFAGEGAAARLKVASHEQFDEEVIAKAEAVMATDKVAESVGRGPLSRARQDEAEIKRLTGLIEGLNQRGETMAAKGYKSKLENAVNSQRTQMRVLIDILPENADPSFPVQPGQFVTIKYKDTKRKGEILVVSNLRVRYKVDAVDGTMEMDAKTFKSKWGTEILEYVEDTRRIQYLGATPGKASTTGRKLIATYQTRTTPTGVVEVLLKPPDTRWWPLLDCDMSHSPVDAVDYWNSTGRHTGRKSEEVRTWMLDHKNYILEPSKENQGRGSRNKANYLLPTK
ncbi:hypothetical protein [Nocardioides panacisoli]|uniref:Uncharacterized protein n=1 Tax=Nocardioides panacisoli TaxID=627624 RepID=A0ABP7HWK5_9ACTN